MPLRKVKALALIRRITPVHIVAIVASIYLVLTVSYIILTGLSNGLNMDTYAADGTFQLYNPMRRLIEGQIIGKDFPFFHGIGVPLLHFPLFYLLGHNVFAADATKWLMSPLVFLAATFIFYLAFFRSLSRSLVSTALLTIIAFVCIDVIWPGNSLLGIRTTFPIITAAFMLWRPSFVVRIKQRSVSLYYPIVSILLGLSVACGTEQGLAAIVAYVSVEIITAIKSKYPIKKWWLHVSLKILGAVLATYAVLSIFSLGHANDALRYALIDIPKDQGWYFGAPPNGYLAWNTLWYIIDKPVLIYMMPIMLLGSLAFALGARFKLISKTELYGFTFLIIYGIVVFFASIVGYWAPNAQLVPLTRVFGLILVALIIRAGLRYAQVRTKKRHNISRWLPVALLLILIAVFSWHSLLAYKQVRSFHIRSTLREVKSARHAPDGTYVSPLWRQRIATFQPYITPGATVWSTYTGAYDSMRDQLNGSKGGEDYIIHALGPERRAQYADDFVKQKPDFVITLRPDYFPYEEWLWIRNWDFYSQVFKDYAVTATNGSHILWKRNEAPKEGIGSTTSGNLARQSDGSYTLSVGATDRVRLYEATVSYDTSKLFPMSDKFSRYLLSIDSTSSIQHLDISLPSYKQQWTFPLILKPGQTEITLSAHTNGLVYGDGLLKINSIKYTEINLTHQNTYPFYDNFCSFGGPGPYGIKCDAKHLDLTYYQTQAEADAFLRQ